MNSLPVWQYRVGWIPKCHSAQVSAPACRHNAQRNADEHTERRVHDRIPHAHERKHDEIEHDIPYHVVRECRKHLLEQEIAPVYADRAVNAVFFAVAYASRFFYEEPHDEQQREHDEEN